MIEIIEGDQGTDEWNQHRLGSIGASSVSKIITTQHILIIQNMFKNFKQEKDYLLFPLQDWLKDHDQGIRYNRLVS